MMIVSYLIMSFYFLITFFNYPSLFSYVTRVFTQQRLSFELNTCNLFQSRVEYFGRDLIANGNLFTVSTFDLLQKRLLPSQGISLLSFIGLCYFCTWYYPWFNNNNNLWEYCSNFIVAIAFISWDIHHLPSSYYMNVKLILLLLLFSSDMSVLNPSPSK